MLTSRALAEAVGERFPTSYGEDTLAKIGRNAFSSWEQTGHLVKGRPTTKIRAQVTCRPANVTYVAGLRQLARQIAAENPGTDTDASGAASLAATTADGVCSPVTQLAGLALLEAGGGDDAADDVSREAFCGLHGLVVGERDRYAQRGEILRCVVGECPRERAGLPRATRADQRDAPVEVEPVRELALDLGVAGKCVEGDVVGRELVVAQCVRQRVLGS